MTRKSIVERAFELGRSGTVANVDHLLRELRRESYELVDAHFAGHSSLRRQLSNICRAAWLAAGNAPLDSRRRKPEAVDQISESLST